MTTKIPVELSSTPGIVDGSNATAITIDSSEDVTLAGNINLVDNKKAIFGTGDDLQIYHDSSNSYIQDAGTGTLRILSDDVRIMNAAGTEISAQFIQDGEARLKFDNSTKLATKTTGVDVTGVLAVNSGTTDTAATFTSSDTAVAVNFVASDNSMQIATSSTDGIIKNNGAGSFRFFNNGSEAARINSSGLVGIGLTSPSSPLTIKSSATHSGGGLRIIQDSGTNLVASLFGGVNSGTRFGRLELSETSGDAINVRISADPGLTSYINAGSFGIGTTSVLSGNKLDVRGGNIMVGGYGGGTDYGLILTPDDGSGYWNVANITGGHLTFNRSATIGSTEKMRIDSSGNVDIADGNLVVASGHGIDFSATSDASGMSSELLDDYEEGTFSGTTNGSVYSGTYTKIGRICHVSFEVDNSSSTGTSIAVMPFSSKAGTAGNGAQPTFNTSNANDNVYVAIYNSGSTAYIYSRTGATQSVTTGTIFVNFVYETD